MPAKSYREKILLVDDVPANLAVLTSALEPLGYDIYAVPNGTIAMQVAARVKPDLILLDVMMPGVDGLETCRRLKQSDATREPPVIFITARGELENVVEGFRSGGVDYVVKPFQIEEVLNRVATHLRISRLTRELREKNHALEARTLELTAEIERRREAETALQIADNKLSAFSDVEAARGSLAGLVGSSGQLKRITGEIRRLLQFPNTSVLITGESGTGKELVARAIHFGSARARAPFVPVNCVAIPAELADGGTMFLDEVGDMPPGLQAKLLRVLEDGWVTPVGATEPRKVDVRVIAATNADLAARIAAGSFREDLYFRLARYPIGTPTLRERLEDVPLLAEHFLGVFSAEMGRPSPGLSPTANAALQAYSFPGNIRELKNIIERALIASGGEIILPEHLNLVRGCSHTAPPAAASAGKALAATLPLNLAAAEDALIQRALNECDGNIAEAARLLGVHRTRIYRKLAQEESAGK